MFLLVLGEVFSKSGKIAKYKKHFDSLNAVEKIEIKEEIEILHYHIHFFPDFEKTSPKTSEKKINKILKSQKVGGVVKIG